VHPLSLLVATFAIGALAMAPLAAREWIAGPPIAWRPAVFAAFGYVAVFPSAVAYFLYNEAAAAIGPSAAGQATSLMPLFGAGLAAALLGEPLHGYHAAGMALILAGIAVSMVASRPVRDA
jgi:drug/metabolite transporter (DMT)-like permease